MKLEEESGLTVATEAAEQLFSSIRLGQWYRAAEVARELSFSSISSEDAVSMLLEIKYFELVDSGSIDEALVCLRGELSEHIADRNRLCSQCSRILFIWCVTWCELMLAG